MQPIVVLLTCVINRASVGLGNAGGHLLRASQAAADLASVVVLADADRHRQRQWLSSGIRLTAHASEGGGKRLRSVLLSERPTWLIVGETSDDAQIHSAIGDVRRVGQGTKVAVLGPDEDFSRCERWARQGVACYLASSSADDRIIRALNLSDHEGVVVIDACFQGRLAEFVGLFEPEPGLSARELQLLKLVAGGLRTDEIAKGLHLSGHTVEFHFRNIISKLGARNRTQAVARAVILGLITAAECVGTGNLGL